MAEKTDQDRAMERAVRAAAFAHAANKDARAENGITGRVDFMLDQMLKAKDGKKTE